MRNLMHNLYDCSPAAALCCLVLRASLPWPAAEVVAGLGFWACAITLTVGLFARRRRR